MRQNTDMYENARVFFVVLWYLASGCLFAMAVLNLVTWGGYLEYLLAAGIVWGAAMLGTIVTSI